MSIYRAIRENAFPAVKIRGRYVALAGALERLAAEATWSLACVDVADYVLQVRDRGHE